MNNFYVYIYLNSLENNQPFYVGKGKGNRYKVHLTNTKEKIHNWSKYNLIQKIRQEKNCNPPIEIYRNNLSEEDALYLEAELIAFYGRKDNNTGTLLNLTDGGDGVGSYWLGKKRTKANNQKISNSRKNKISVKDKDSNMFVINKDDPRWLLGELVGIRKGMKESDETRAKKSISKKGIRPSCGFKEGNVPWNKGIPTSEETKLKISKGAKHKTYIRTEEIRKKQSETMKNKHNKLFN
jgi:hypothetical protein